LRPFFQKALQETGKKLHDSHVLKKINVMQATGVAMQQCSNVSIAALLYGYLIFFT